MLNMRYAPEKRDEFVRQLLASADRSFSIAEISSAVVKATGVYSLGRATISQTLQRLVRTGRIIHLSYGRYCSPEHYRRLSEPASREAVVIGLLLRALADKAYHHTTELARVVGLPRDAVAEHLNRLADRGLVDRLHAHSQNLTAYGLTLSGVKALEILS